MKSDFLTTLKEEVIVADGAMGTMLASRGLHAGNIPAPALNLLRPTFIESLHEEYVEAGARLIQSNTFGANRLALDAAQLSDKVREVNAEGVRLARQAAGERAWVAGSIGPVGPRSQNMDVSEVRELYHEQALALIESAVDVLILETFGDVEDARLAIRTVREISSDVPVMFQMAFTLTGTTTSGSTPQKMIASLKDEKVDVFGHNCGGGERAAVAAARELVQLTDKPLSIFSNRGLADLDEHGNPVYIAGHDYFARQGEAIAELGVNIIGGCCGTSPADIAALSSAIGTRKPAERVRTTRPSVRIKKTSTVIPRQAAITDIACDGVKVIAEVDPPRGMDFGPHLEGSRMLLESGVHSITIADNPLGVMRMSNLALASILIRELNANITLHIACRDRNLLGSQSHLLGAASLGITNILAVTGDPVATAAHKESSGVFDVSSQNMMKAIKAMKDGGFPLEGELRPEFCIGGAFNSGMKRLDAEAKRAGRKMEAGAQFFMTQPVYDAERANQILDLLEPMQVPVFIGVMPLVSERNAEFLHNEVPGISIPDAVRERMRGKKGKEGRAEGLKLSMELIEGFAARSRAVYLITPMSFYSMVGELARFARSLVPA